MPATVGDTHRPLRDVVCDALRDDIVGGRYLPGVRLIEDRLAGSLGVSRNPIREALRVLEAEGYVTMIPRRGAVVAQLSDQEIREVFEVRGALEERAWRLAAQKATDADIAQLTKMLDEFRKAIAREDEAHAGVLHGRFHDLVLRTARNGLLRRLMTPLDARMNWITRGVEYDRGHSLEQHERLVQALAIHDEDAAAALAHQHIQAYQEWYWAVRERSERAELAAATAAT